jgi:hypothetical protein
MGPILKIFADAKRGSMHADRFEDILEEFPPALDGIKPLCREVRGILFPLQGGKLGLSTHQIHGRCMALSLKPSRLQQPT